MSQSHISVALRRLVRERAGDRCEYCLIPEAGTFAPHWIDHIVAEKHGGPTEADNLAMACMVCNQHKGTDLTSIDPESGETVVLFHPRRDRWTDHFRFDGGSIEPMTAVGRVTVRLLQLNLPRRVAERDRLMTAGLLLIPGEKS
jgi:hypothetical protein